MTPEKALDISLLLEFYGELLTERQRELAELYYNDDLSLSEVAENVGITRQGVRDGLKKAEDALKEAEDKLHMYASWRERERLVSFIEKRLSETKSEDPEIIKALEGLRSLG